MESRGTCNETCYHFNFSILMTDEIPNLNKSRVSLVEALIIQKPVPAMNKIVRQFYLNA